MGKGSLKHKSLAVGIVLLFLFSSISSTGYETNVDSIDEEADCDTIENLKVQPRSLPLVDAAWPMKCHDLHHTSRSPYSTADNPYDELWKFETGNWLVGGIIIDEDGTLYFGDFDYYLNAVYPDGTLKWRYGRTGGWISSSPAIDENGVVYATSWDSNLYAVYLNNGTQKWIFPSSSPIASSPTVGNDGVIYFGNGEGRVYAVNSDGTEKWHYDTSDSIFSDPAIGDDGTVYIGSWDTYLYALYPNNGTLCWRFKTGHYVKGPPSIADDGTIYIGSWDDYLYALYPNGSMKWRHQVGLGTESNPSIGLDGTIYCGGGNLYAVNPNGTRKWTFDFGEDIHSHQSSPAISADGIIYIGTLIGSDGGEIVAVNPDGTERWRKWIAEFEVQSSPCIGSDGTVYIGSSFLVSGDCYGYLYAFGERDPSAPEPPTITGETQGQYGEEYDYTFVSTDPEEQNVCYYVEWGDGEFTDWTDYHGSEEEVVLSHTWDERGTYVIRARAKNTDNLWGPWGELEVKMPVNQHPFYSLFLRFLERFPRAFPILRQILDIFL